MDSCAFSFTSAEAIVWAYLALGGSHLCKQSLGNFGPLHLLLDLIVDVGVDVEDGALGFAVPLAGQRGGFHLAFNTKLITGRSDLLLLGVSRKYVFLISP